METANVTPLELGFGMQGLGHQVAQYVQEVCTRFDKVTYLEIGVGEGTTLAAIADRLRKLAVQWRAIGVDLPDGYSLDLFRVNKTMRTKMLPFAETRTSVLLPWNRVTLHLADSQKFLLTWDELVNLVLIDGCHGKPCAKNDFLNIEPWVVPGGYVMFHDFGQDQQWQSQPHCPEGIDVRGACAELGLLDNNREGWRFIGTLIGDKPAGSGDMGVFEKLK